MLAASTAFGCCSSYIRGDRACRMISVFHERRICIRFMLLAHAQRIPHLAYPPSPHKNASSPDTAGSTHRTYSWNQRIKAATASFFEASAQAPHIAGRRYVRCRPATTSSPPSHHRHQSRHLTAAPLPPRPPSRGHQYHRCHHYTAAATAVAATRARIPLWHII